MRLTPALLDAREKDLIREEALAVLERVGMRFSGSRLLPLLAEAGAAVDHAAGVVRFPPDLVARALVTAPREFVMAGAMEDDDVTLRAGGPARFCNSGCVAFTLDDETGERRPSTLDDLRRATILLDETPELAVLWTVASANDVPEEHRELVQYATILGETGKHLTLVDYSLPAYCLLPLVEVVAGDLARFRARPRLSTLMTVASPLQVDGRLLDMHVAMARHGSPVEVFSAAMAGGTAPVTLAGTLTMCVAEFLGVLTVLQVAVPGSRVLMGASPTVLDMRATTIAYGAVESGLMCAAGVEMGHELGVPVICPALATEAKELGIQAGFEKALKGLTVAAAGADLMTGGIGTLDSASTLYLPQIVIDAEIAAMITRLVGEVEVTREAIQRDVIERVGIGGHFLGEKETRRRVRAGEHFSPTIASRLSYEAWAAGGRREIDAARERVAAILAGRERPTPYLSPDQLRELEAIAGYALGGAGR